jgi:hypothetical protein
VWPWGNGIWAFMPHHFYTPVTPFLAIILEFPEFQKGKKGGSNTLHLFLPFLSCIPSPKNKLE